MRIEIFGKAMCDLCSAVTEYIALQNVPFEYFSVEGLESAAILDILRRANGKRTLPIIFIDGRHIGDFDELRQFFESRNESKREVGQYYIPEKGRFTERHTLHNKLGLSSGGETSEEEGNN